VNFFAELKRRNVFRVGIAYLIGSWLLAQIAELLLDTFNAPEWTMQFIFVVLLIGFPIAIFFAWAFELTPDGVKRESEVDRSQSIRQKTGQKLNRGIIIILVLALAYFVWESRFANTGSNTVTPQTSEQTSTEEKRALTPDDAEPVVNQSVAVLPFINMSSDPEQEYFSDGITEEIINALVKIPGLSVPARTSVFGFKGQQGDVRKIGQQLSVAHVLEGSIRSQGDQVRITAQLIKVDDGFHLWSETFDRKLDNIFVVQEEIATAIAKILIGELGLDIDTVPNKTSNMAAYDSYLQGRALLHKRGEDNLDQAVVLFKHTTELDPQFAPAWAAMALTYSVMDINAEVVAKTISTAKHALSLDPENVDALDALASVYRDSWQWAKAELYFEQAMAIDPQSSELLEDYAEFLGMVGRLDEYLAVAGKGYAIDPLLGPLADSYTWALMDHRQFDKAIAVIEQWNGSMNPEDVLAFWDETYWKMIPMMASGDTAGAIAMARQLGPEHMTIPVRDAIIGLLENPANVQAREVLRTAISGDNISQISQYDFDAYTATLVLLHAGDVDFVIERRIADAQNFSFGNVEPLWSPIYAPFRQHPRFGEYLELLNLPTHWDQAGWPDICQRKADGRIECQ
jgi:TolB-like protein/tetratricopeptide (TPR) repeat protein